MNQDNMEFEDDNAKIFPQRLMDMLTNPSNHGAIAWLPHGKSFVIVDRKTFADEVLPRYFRKSKYTSFTRKLNRWNFARVTRGPEMGSYHHEYFQRDNESLCTQMYCKNERAKFATRKEKDGSAETCSSSVFVTSGGTSDVGRQADPSTSMLTTSSKSMIVPQTVQSAQQSDHLDILRALQVTKPPVQTLSAAAHTRTMFLHAAHNQQTMGTPYVPQTVLEQAMQAYHIPHTTQVSPESLILRLQLAAIQTQQPEQRQRRTLHSYRASAA